MAPDLSLLPVNYLWAEEKKERKKVKLGDWSKPRPANYSFLKGVTPFFGNF